MENFSLSKMLNFRFRKRAVEHSPLLTIIIALLKIMPPAIPFFCFFSRYPSIEVSFNSEAGMAGMPAEK